MKYAVEIGSGDIICKPSFIKVGSGVERIPIQTHTDRKVI
jgi:hypothetical protein